MFSCYGYGYGYTFPITERVGASESQEVLHPQQYLPVSGQGVHGGGRQHQHRQQQGQYQGGEEDDILKMICKYSPLLDTISGKDQNCSLIFTTLVTSWE